MERKPMASNHGDQHYHQRIRDLLAQAPLFSDLPVEQLDPLVRGTRKIRAQRGEIIFHRGDPCVGFHLVIFGQVKLVYVSAVGVERVVRLIGPGDSFGEALMFLEKDYIVTAEALCDTLLLHVARGALFDRLDQDPRLARRMLGSLSRRVFMLMGDVGAYTMRSGQQRLIGYLFREARGRFGEPFRIEVTKGVIASRLNLTPEHFSRMLRELSERRLIRVRGREFTILDPDGLRAVHG